MGAAARHEPTVAEAVASRVGLAIGVHTGTLSAHMTASSERARYIRSPRLREAHQDYTSGPRAVMVGATAARVGGSRSDYWRPVARRPSCRSVDAPCRPPDRAPTQLEN